MKAINTLLLVSALGFFALGMTRAGQTYQEAIDSMQPYLNKTLTTMEKVKP